jgi:hypothetical protein
MKTLNTKMLVVALALTLTAISCSKDEATKKNHMKFDNTEYDISKGIIKYYGQYNQSPPSYNFDIYLFSSGINYDGSAFSGTGTYFYLEMFSSSSAELVSGTYTFNSLSENPNMFDYGVLRLNYNTELQVNHLVSSGTVKIVKTDAVYEITIDCISNGKSLTGYYKGTLNYYNNSSIAK